MLENFFNRRCDIGRPDANDETDRYNLPVRELTAVASEVPCRLTRKAMRIVDRKTGEMAWVRADLILLPAGTDVQHRDVITIDGEHWNVETVFRRQRFNSESHVSVIVEALNE